MQPTWLVDILAGVMLATSTYCVARLLAARFWGRALHRDVNVAHVAMGLSMAGMLVATFHTLPDGAWEIIFAGFVLWFGARAARHISRQGISVVGTHHVSHNLTHMVMAGGMFYMFVETSSPVAASARSGGAMSAMGAAGATSNLGALTLLLVFVLFASAIWHADGLTQYTSRRLPARRAAPVAAHATAPSPAGLGPRGGAATPQKSGAPVEAARDDDDAQLEQAHWLAPRLEMGCHIAMCITMGYMLVLLL